ncbi:tRNA lysidine(34) synthetase TilS [Fibrella arboris]|uniref:tRNA lysidine(34) synthetase TilS n=1 Tax=Fibrella arboris TaxID=3242486 RepID=UPI00352015D8
MLPDGFLAFINEHQLFTSADKVLVAVSGGVDSVVLASLLKAGGFSFGIAHVNFGLRGTDSDADAAFVENIALSYGVPFHLTRFDTIAEASQQNESTQVTARRLRYDWFRQLQLQHGYLAVATAHHLNDVLETMLLNLTRGTGLAGLRGMPIHSDLTSTWPRVVRPLWAMPRASIEAYAQAYLLNWREDSSNSSDKYSRNQIRHHVVPVLERLNPGLMQTVSRSLSQLRSADTILKHELHTSFTHCTQPVDEGFVIDVAKLKEYPEPLFRLGEWVKPYGFTTDVLAQCWQVVNQAGNVPDRTGQVFLAPSHRLLYDRGKLWLLPRHADSRLPVEILDWPETPIAVGTDGYLSVGRLGRDQWDGQWPTSTSMAFLDTDAAPFPWTIRRWQNGDRFNPLGMTGSRLVSDFLADNKLPIHQRESTWVLESNGRLIWVLGLRLSNVARLTQATSQLIILHWQSVGQ